jgi:hypothetical protein
MASELLKRIFKKESISRVFSIARFMALLVGAGAASVWFMTGGNIFASVGFFITAFVLFRYGQIKGYLP